MEFNGPAGINPIDAQKVVGKPVTRIDGPLKVSGAAPYAYERHDVAPDAVYGFVIGSAIATGRVDAIDTREALASPGVIAVLTTLDHPQALPVGPRNVTPLFGGRDINHYHQAIACVVAETFEQARAAASLVRADYTRRRGAFDLAAVAPAAPYAQSSPDQPGHQTLGDFESAFAAAQVKIDQHYTTPNESHAMMEPFATIAKWTGDKLTIWTSNQTINAARQSLGAMLSLAEDDVRVISSFIGGGFGAKLQVRADAVIAALAARKIGRPVKVALQRPLIANNATHRAATIQRIRIGADRDGRITSIAHENWSGNLKGQRSENGTRQTPKLYAGPNRLIAHHVATLDLPEGSSMRAPGEAPGHMALEIAVDELAEKLGMDPVALRILNEPGRVPGSPEKRFSDRNLVECLRIGAERFDWKRRSAKPAQVREGRWLIGLGVAAGYRGGPARASAARVRLTEDHRLVVETDMTDIGTGSYTILAQTAAEMLGLPLGRVAVKLGDSADPVSTGSGGQAGAASSTAGVYAACLALRQKIGERLGFDGEAAVFANGEARLGDRVYRLAEVGALSATDEMAYGKFKTDYDVGTYASHFAEVRVDRFTGETRLNRMLAVCDAGRILNPLTARSQVIGAMVMATGAALMEELIVDKRFGFFVNHDLAGYEVPVHADIPRLECEFLDTLDPIVSPMKAKGIGELGICGSGAAIANAVYNATGIRVRDYPITLDKILPELPPIA